MRRITVGRKGFHERQMVDRHTVGHLPLAVALQLRRRPQIGDIGDADADQRFAARVVEVAQFTGPEEPARPDARLLGDVAKVPCPRKRRH